MIGVGARRQLSISYPRHFPMVKHDVETTPPTMFGPFALVSKCRQVARSSTHSTTSGLFILHCVTYGDYIGLTGHEAFDSVPTSLSRKLIIHNVDKDLLFELNFKKCSASRADLVQ